MPLPLNEFYRNLAEKVRDQENINYYAHPITDAVFNGVVRAVHYDPYTDTAWMEVVQPTPRYIQNGTLEFVNFGQHPLLGESTARYDRVCVGNCPAALVALYFPIGTPVTYWQYSGTLADAEYVLGTYLTNYPGRVSFDAKIVWNCNPPSNFASSSSGCDTRGAPTVTPQLAFTYEFTALSFTNTNGGALSDLFSPYIVDAGGQGPNSMGQWTGTCYNKAELLNLTDGESGTGVATNAAGVRLDDTSGQTLTAVGPLIARVEVYTDPDPNTCEPFIYLFGPVSNTFSHAPNSCSSSSSGCQEYYWACWKATYDCDTHSWGSPGRDGTYDICSCNGPITTWFADPNGGVCDWRIFVECGKCILGSSSSSGTNPTSPPNNIVPNGCCPCDSDTDPVCWWTITVLQNCDGTFTEPIFAYQCSPATSPPTGGAIGGWTNNGLNRLGDACNWSYLIQTTECCSSEGECGDNQPAYPGNPGGVCPGCSSSSSGSGCCSCYRVEVDGTTHYLSASGSLAWSDGSNTISNSGGSWSLSVGSSVWSGGAGACPPDSSDGWTLVSGSDTLTCVDCDCDSTDPCGEPSDGGCGGYTGTITVVTGFDPTTCEVTDVSLNFIGGCLMSVGD